MKSSCGNLALSARRTVKPPTPESKTPIAASEECGWLTINGDSKFGSARGCRNTLRKTPKNNCRKILAQKLSHSGLFALKRQGIIGPQFGTRSSAGESQRL